MTVPRTGIIARAARIRTLLSLRSVRGLGDVRLTGLLRAHGSPEAAMKALAAERPAAVAALGRPGVARRIKHIEAVLAERPDIHVLAACDESYPESLLHLHDPPPVLFLRGRTSLIGRAGVSVVGTRACTEYGADVTRMICESLAAAGVPVISGLAHGIDRVAHQTALGSNGPTVAVIGCGIDVVYPAEHARLQHRIASDGLLVSEFPPGAPALAHHFPKRNRIIAALARVIVVIEAPARSGALITAEHGLDLGREIMAVPGPIGRRTSEGTNALIRDGATLVTHADDVLASYGDSTRSEPVTPSRAGREPALPTVGGPAVAVGARNARALQSERPDRASSAGTAEHAGTVPAGKPGRAEVASWPMTGPAAAIRAVLGPEPIHTDDLGLAAGLSSAATLAALLELELAGIAQAVPGGRYRLAGPHGF